MFTLDDTCNNTQSRIMLESVMLNNNTTFPISIKLMNDISPV